MKSREPNRRKSTRGKAPCKQCITKAGCKSTTATGGIKKPPITTNLALLPSTRPIITRSQLSSSFKNFTSDVLFVRLLRISRVTFIFRGLLSLLSRMLLRSTLLDFLKTRHGLVCYCYSCQVCYHNANGLLANPSHPQRMFVNCEVIARSVPPTFTLISVRTKLGFLKSIHQANDTFAHKDLCSYFVLIRETTRQCTLHGLSEHIWLEICCIPKY